MDNIILSSNGVIVLSVENLNAHGELKKNSNDLDLYSDFRINKKDIEESDFIFYKTELNNLYVLKSRYLILD